MDPIAAGFWGACFGVAFFVFWGSIAAFVRSEHPVGLRGAWATLASAFFAAAFLGFLPMPDDGLRLHFLACVAVTLSASLIYLLLAMQGLLRSRRRNVRALAGLTGASLAVLAVVAALEPLPAFLLGVGVAASLALAGLVLCGIAMVRGERLAGWATLGMSSVLVAALGLANIALTPAPGLPVHIASAIAGTVFVVTMGVVGWQRYAYLIELHEVLAHGPSYDPVTRMRSHAETGQMVGAAFRGETDAPLGVIVVSIGNLYALERLHGKAAVNHALFVCAGRLRRYAPVDVEMGRLGDDAFLLLLRGAQSMDRLIALGRLVAQRLSRRVVLSTSREPQAPERTQMRWEAQLGVGVLAVSSVQVRAGTAVAMAKAMSRTAWTYPSRVAWFNEHKGRISELPEDALAATEPVQL